MEWAAYLDALRHDGEALAVAATDLTAPVPSCPGWTVADLVDHTGMVHRHKELIVRSGDNVEWPPPVSPPGADLVAWFREGVRSLVAELSRHDPAEPCWTWHDPDPTVGFWYRRMAQETLVHRIDAELATGSVGAVDASLAADGFDELLTAFLVGAEDWMTVERGSATIEFVAEDTGHRWLLRQTSLAGTSPNTGNVYTDLAGYEFVDAADEEHARVSGSATDLLRFGWGRGDLDTLVVSGNVAHAERFRSAAAEATQ